MGEIDTMAKAYLSDKMRFADAFNFSIYGGDYVIKPDTLSPMDTTAIALPYGTNAKAAIQKYRDLLRREASPFRESCMRPCRTNRRFILS